MPARMNGNGSRRRAPNGAPWAWVLLALLAVMTSGHLLLTTFLDHRWDDEWELLVFALLSALVVWTVHEMALRFFAQPPSGGNSDSDAPPPGEASA
jgi:hypothetical protein